MVTPTLKKPETLRLKLLYVQKITEATLPMIEIYYIWLSTDVAEIQLSATWKTFDKRLAYSTKLTGPNFRVHVITIETKNKEKTNSAIFKKPTSI